MAGGPGVPFEQMQGPKLAANGRLPATLPEPIKRARDSGYCGFAGEGNVVERSERYASVAKPEGPRIKGPSAGRLVSCWFLTPS